MKYQSDLKSIKILLNQNNFNDAESDKPLTRARAKLINYKNAAQLALLMLKEEGGYSEIETIDSLCSEPCPSCDTEADY